MLNHREILKKCALARSAPDGRLRYVDFDFKCGFADRHFRRLLRQLHCYVLLDGSVGIDIKHSPLF